MIAGDRSLLHRAISDIGREPNIAWVGAVNAVGEVKVSSDLSTVGVRFAKSAPDCQICHRHAAGAALSEATTPATRGLAMGGYSTAIYLGVGMASIGLGPVMATWGYTAGFTLADLVGGLGTLLAVAIWGRPRLPCG